MHVCIHVYRHVDMYLRAGQEGNMTPARNIKSRSMDTQSNRHVRGNVYGMHVDRCLIMHIGICVDMSIQMFMDMFIAMCLDMCPDRCIHLCIDMCTACARTCVCACVQMRLSATTEDARAEALRRRDKKDTGNERQADIYWRDWTETMAEVHMYVHPYMRGDACRYAFAYTCALAKDE